MKKIAPFALVFLFLATLGSLPLLRRSAELASAPPRSATTSLDGSPALSDSAVTPAPGAPSHPAPPSADAAPSASTATSPSPTAPAASAPPPTLSAPFAPTARLASAATAADLLQAADLTDPIDRAYVVARLAEMQDSQRETALATAERLGIPLRIDGPGRKISILYDFRDGRPLYRTTFNTNAAISTGANQLRDLSAPYGLTGLGLRVGVWDEAKVRNTHQEFAGGRVAIRDSASTFSDHATHVAGTIGATGVVANAKGMAPQAGIDSYDWNNDYAEMTAAGAATATDTNRLSLSNHSYGFDAVTADMGRYETEARTLDALAAALPHYSVFWAAGNEQDLLTARGGYQSITFTGLAKNVITIGAGDDAVSGGVRAPSVGTLAYFSSLGPSDDGRIKPDLTANGVDLYSPVATGNTAYDGTYSGTSMATPNAVGSALLVQQLHAREFAGRRLRASTLKALLIHTADDVGRPGPDYQYGWGYLNVRAAADLVLAHKASLASPKLIEGTLTNAAKTQTHTFTWDGVTPIRATLAWTDPAGAAQTATDSRTPNLVHDLDLRLTAPDGVTTNLPYVMPFVGTWTTASMALDATTGVNRVDNVEQVRVASPSQPGNYTVTVTLNGSLTTASQVYSLVVTGGTNVEANPAPVVTLTSPADGAVVLPGAPLTFAATATDNTIGGGAGVVAGVEFFAGTTSLGVVSSSPYTLSWTPPSAGAYALTAVATDTEGASGSSAAARITVLSGDGTPTVAGFSPSSGVAGDSVTLTGTNFAAVSAVRFNGITAFFTLDSPTTLRATVPASATTGVVTVTTPRGTATSANAFTVIQNPVLISQLYGAGGNSGAVYNSDYVELHNRGDTPVTLTGWSVQYASASGTTWQTVPLTGSLAPGKHYLVKLAGGTTGAALPTPDATGSINMSGTQGKVALRNTSAAFTGSNPAGQSGLQDLVGFGLANAYEGSAAAPSPSATTALFRAAGGATDTGDNAADFATATPAPRNTSAGAPAAPVISSPATAGGVVGQPFTYQIAATNTPTSFAATGLPAGLAINPSSGLVSGTPTTAGASSVTISATNATGTGTATLALTITSGGGGTPTGGYTVDFEDSTKGAYASANVTLNGISWNFTEALIGGDSSDFKNGTQSARLRGYATSVVTMLADKSGGIGTITFQHRRYGTDTQVEWIVETSADAGSTWMEAGRFTAGASVATFSATVENTAATRLRIRSAATGNSNRRVNIDDILLTDATVETTPTFSTWAEGLSDPAPAADPDRDGVANLLEYFMALDPTVPEQIAPTISASGGVLQLDYRRSKALVGVTGAVQWSASLAPAPAWSTTGVTDVLVSDQGTYELRRATVPFAPGETAKFLRLRVTLPSP